VLSVLQPRTQARCLQEQQTCEKCGQGHAADPSERVDGLELRGPIAYIRKGLGPVGSFSTLFCRQPSFQAILYMRPLPLTPSFRTPSQRRKR
jgi:hypothetical protein